MPVLARLAAILLALPLLAAAAPAPEGPLAPFDAELRAHGIDPDHLEVFALLFPLIQRARLRLIELERSS